MIKSEIEVALTGYLYGRLWIIVLTAFKDFGLVNIKCTRIRSADNHNPSAIWWKFQRDHTKFTHNDLLQ